VFEWYYSWISAGLLAMLEGFMCFLNPNNPSFVILGVGGD
jgi:hypothetical protein